MKNRIRFFRNILACTFVLALILVEPGFADLTSGKKGISAHKAANMIHAVIEAGRTAYSKYIVNRLHEKKLLVATERWREDGGLLLPAQFLKISSEISNSRGVGLRYRLTSLWPINQENLPRSETEKTGLEEVTRNPDKPFTWVVQKGDMWFYEAIYPDKAVTESCVSCHNSHPKSSKADFKIGDVMGGIVIDFPLGTHSQKAPTGAFQVSPEVVTDYVHAVLQADRKVYSKYIVQRMEEQNIIQSRGDWKEQKALMLPAQFLMKVGQIANRRKVGLHFDLISLWPINPRNGPTNTFEKMALERVKIHPVRPYERLWTDRKPFFQSVYPDRAVTNSCVTCHNDHPASPKRDFKINDVMGGIAVTIALE